jgi:5-deoxy-glucuronate isomerase
MVFRKTNAHTGRRVPVTPANSTNRYLSYGRIVLGGGDRTVSFTNGHKETSLIVLSGSARVRTGAEEHELSQFDGIYIPRDSSVQVSTTGSADIAEFAAEVSTTYPLQVIRRGDSALTFTAGKPANLRDVTTVIGKNVAAGRLMVGYTVSEPGNWTSWPPHEHTEMLEEMYVYFDMPEPAFGIQMVYNNTEYPELVTVVRDGDAVLMPSGYHPNVSVPGHRICFLWAMAAHREVTDRQYGVVNVQPGFK